MVSAIMRKTSTNESARIGYSPSEFARACGKHPTWAYRQIYAQKVKVVTGLGALLIPSAEVDRVMSEAKPYDPKPKRKKDSAEQRVGREAVTA